MNFESKIQRRKPDDKKHSKMTTFTLVFVGKSQLRVATSMKTNDNTRKNEAIEPSLSNYLTMSTTMDEREFSHVVDSYGNDMYD
jgi:hypothetical protein